MNSKVKKIALLSGGGDCPGLNAVIRTITKIAIEKYNWEVIGFVYGYRGLYNNNYVEEINDNPESYRIERRNHDILGFAKDSVIDLHKEKYLKKE